MHLIFKPFFLFIFFPCESLLEMSQDACFITFLKPFFIICTCFQSTKAVYNRILDLRIATPQIIINFGTFLEEHRYFEEAFKVSKTRRAGHISLPFRAKR